MPSTCRVIALILLLLSRAALAQPLFTIQRSIEAVIANADAVAIGTVHVFIKGEGIEDELVVAVDEMLKGAHRKHIVVRIARSAWTAPPEGARVLVVSAAEETGEDAIVSLEEAGAEVLSARRIVLNNPDEVIAIAKETIRRMPGTMQVELFRLRFPAAAAKDTKWESRFRVGHVEVVVPVDQSLGLYAEATIHSKDVWEREEAVRALRFFRSKENIASVRMLLMDQESVQRHGPEQGRHMHYFPVRDAAYDTLRYWGVDAEKPVIEVPVDGGEVPR
jgi:hypothetical protein